MCRDARLLLELVMKKALSLLCFLAALSGCASNQVVQNTSIPVSKVVMYQSGVGYVERVGSVEGDKVSLSIRTDQINDILKSLTVIDRSDGHPVSVTLPVDKASRRTTEVPNGGMLALFEAFRGAHVTIDARGASKVEGRIVGVESVNATNENGEPVESWKLTVVDREATLHAFNYSDVKYVRIHDANLADGLNRSLDVSLNDGDWKQVEIAIQLDGAKKRDVALSYIVAMPTWKPAYRLVLGDDGKSVIQGWAVISNVTGADWENIEFSLVSGQPMSFTYDLYTPQFIQRPDLSYRAQSHALAPKVQSSGYNATKSTAVNGAVMNRMADADDVVEEEGVVLDMAAADTYVEKSALAQASKKRAAAGSAKGGKALAKSAPAPKAVSYDEIVSQDYGSGMDAEQVGAFDSYTLSKALSVKDGSTALVNLLQRELPAREVRLFDVSSIYARSEQNESWQTIELKNDSEVALEPGPITIYHGSTFVGEGYLSRTAPGATAHLTFAAESRVSLRTNSTQKDDDFMLTSVSRGRVSFEYYQVKTYNFDVKSHASEPLSVMAQIPRENCFEPVNFPEDAVVSKDTIAVPISVNPKDATSVSYDARCKRSRATSLDSAQAVEAIENALAHNAIPAAQAEPLRQYASLWRENVSINDQINAKSSVKFNLEADQSEISESLKDLKNVKSASADRLRNQLLTRQRENEKQIASLATELTELRIRASENEIALKALMRTLDYKR